MKKTWLAALTLAGVIGSVGSATAQIAGSTTTTGVTITEANEPAHGWSVKKGILGKTVYNDSGEKLGTVQDLIIDTDKYVAYVIMAPAVPSAWAAMTWPCRSRRSATWPARS